MKDKTKRTFGKNGSQLNTGGPLPGLVVDAEPFISLRNIFLIPALRCGLNALGLLTQGKSNALATQISRQRIVVDTLPESFCGLKIVHLSDLHLDGMPGLAEHIVECIRPLDIDLCFLTRDYRFRVSGPCDGIYPAMEKMLEGLHPRLGTFGILGNHDVSEEVAEMEQLGIKMLVNDAVEIQEGAESL